MGLKEDLFTVLTERIQLGGLLNGKIQSKQ
jgi:hypothetical protein